MKNITFNNHPITVENAHSIWFSSLSLNEVNAYHKTEKMLQAAKAVKLQAARKYGFKDYRAKYIYKQVDIFCKNPTAENFDIIKKATRLMK